MFCFKVVERTAFLCVSRKALGKRRNLKTEQEGKRERELLEQFPWVGKTG